ncbi:SseB family protein [Paracoccus sp. TK19116]|uniref:SseB family protein n=1 Tax=Paracoccus albicereus TaxID=2922394 RepID=A0ABT1MP73_9RHOB|nr:SseB family protein [Paracoccus albicereus]MCQ0970095.1 SseB family protein [Paracoccus albicereus]
MTALDDLCRVPFHDADAPLRARVLSRLADSELTVALDGEADDDRAAFRMFDLPGGPVALAFDRDERLAAIFGHPSAYVAMPGRVLARLLAQEAAGLLVNPGHPSEMLLDAATLAWLGRALEDAPEEAEARTRFSPPDPAVVAILAEPLAERLSDLRGTVTGAALVAAKGADTAGHLLIIAGAAPERQAHLAKALAETLAFLPSVPDGVDVAFSDTAVPDFAVRFDLQPPPKPDRPRPDRPPNLR